MKRKLLLFSLLFAGYSVISADVNYYVSPNGTDSPGSGITANNPWKTLAYAASQVSAGTGSNKIINLVSGTYTETKPVALQPGVSILGAGETVTILKSAGVTVPSSVDQTSSFWKLSFEGSLIQLISDSYSGSNPRYGAPEEILASTNGNQTLSGFTIDGQNKSLKAGVWVESRNNVTMHHVTIKNCQMRGAVFAKGDMYWYVPLPDGKWMNNTKVYNCTFLNNGVDLTGESLGNLCLSGLDGADIYNIKINENQGYGIKFIYVGHFRNVKIHDCEIQVPETDTQWNEDISIELWNFSYNNEIYNINCNTWLSFVNHIQLEDYQPTVAHPVNLKVRNIKMVDGDGASEKESIECALSGVEISESYFQDKGFGIAIWGGKGWGGKIANHDIIIRNNIFVNIKREPVSGFGNSAAVFIPSDVEGYNIKIYNNVFDNLLNALQLDGSSGTEIKNNAFLNTNGFDVQNGSNVTFNNNLKYSTGNSTINWILDGGPILGKGNITGNPGFFYTSNRWEDYYKVSSAGSLVIDKGLNVGIAYKGSAPDIGRWEFDNSTVLGLGQNFPENKMSITIYPNPAKDIFYIETMNLSLIENIEIFNMQNIPVLKVSGGQSCKIKINLQNQPEDVYSIRITHENGVCTKALVLIRWM